MKLLNEFDVGIPVDRAWDTLLDVPRVARALPGATIDPDADGGAWRGTMTVNLGPVTTEYAGTVRVQDTDADDRVASYLVEGREVRDRGSAIATITARLAADAGRTHVVVETDVNLSGRHAKLDRASMEAVAEAILGEFAERLVREQGGGTPPPVARDHAVREIEVRPSQGLDKEREPRTVFAAGLLAGLVVGLLFGRRARS